MVKVFFSYATKDSENYQIPKLVQLLEKKFGIEKVYYWERDTVGSIIEYMNTYVPASDACIFFYSKIAAESEPVKMERDMAVYENKYVIPVFMDINDVPPILKIQAGVNALNKSSEQIISEIYRLISQKFNIPSPSPPPSPALLAAEEAVLKELEKHVGQIPNVTKIEWNGFGFVEDDRHITKLGLYNKELSVLPTSIGDLTNLKVLLIYKNKLSSLPETIGNLRNLVELRLHDNRLASLPNNFIHLTNLQRLGLGGNQFKTLPESIGHLKSLKYLNLRDNQLN
ncbi:MAG: TIR domain-containing protein, partial [Promethearchaeota archaeon]